MKKWFMNLFRSYRNEKRIEKHFRINESAYREVEKDLDVKKGRIDKLEKQVKEMDKMADIHSEHVSNLNTIYLERFVALEKAMQDANSLKGLTERMARVEVMYIEVFRKAQDTYSRSMRHMVTQSGKNSQFIMKYAGEQAEKAIAEIEGEIEKIILIHTDKIVEGVADEYQNKLNEFMHPVENKVVPPIKIIVNAKEYDSIQSAITYDEIVEIAVMHDEGTMRNVVGANYTVTFRFEGGSGNMFKGNKVNVRQGMIFNVSLTDNA
jgi:hypothetical protein